MKRISIFISVIILVFFTCCENKENETLPNNMLTLSGTFETIVQGYSIYELLDDEPYLSFLPKNINSEETMSCYVQEDGIFSVSLPKGETYNCLIIGTMGYIKFSAIDGNEITIPEDAPDELSLGKLEFTYSGVFVPENPLPWLKEGIIDTKNNTPPVIKDITMSEFKKFDESDNYTGSILTFEVDATDDLTRNRALSYIWVLEDIKGNVSFNDAQALTKTFYGNKGFVYTDANPYNGKVTVIAIDTLGGDSKMSLEF
jgi:hypothetical protein